MFFLYNLAIWSYGLIIRLTSPFYNKAKLLNNGRKNQSASLSDTLSTWQSHKKIWIHAASYGEDEMAKPIVKKLQENPDNRLVISYDSPTGYTQTELSDDHMTKIYLPLDLRSNMTKIVDLINPDKVLFIKYEFWFNLLRVLSERQID